MEGVRYEELPDNLTIKDIKVYFRCGTNKAYEIANRTDFPYLLIGAQKVYPKELVKEWRDRHIVYRTRKLKVI